METEEAGEAGGATGGAEREAPAEAVPAEVPAAEGGLTLTAPGSLDQASTPASAEAGLAAEGHCSGDPVEQWRAALRQPGIEGPVRELLDAAGRDRPAPPWQPALQIWALLASRVDARDPGNWAEPAEGALWDQLTALRAPLHEAWTGLRADVGAERALALEITECLLAGPESCARASGEPPAWLTLSALALQMADVERQMGWCVVSQDVPTLIALDSMEARKAAADGQWPEGERLSSERWRATLRSLLPDFWRAARRQEEVAAAAGKAGAAGAGAAAAARQAWDATMRLTGFTHVGRLLEVGRNQGTPEWELALRVWAYLIARINEYVGASPAPLPPDVDLWGCLTVLHGPLHAAWVDRRRGNEWERRQALDIVRRLLTDGDARRRAGPPPPWLTIRALAAALEEAYDDLQREEGQDRLTVMALHAVEAWREERNGPQPSLRRPEWTAALHRVGSLLYQHLLKERAAQWRDVEAREPVLGLLRTAEAEAWPEVETALRVWAYLASRINAPLHEAQTVRAPTPDADFWPRLGKARQCLLEAWAGRRTADCVAAAHAFFLRCTEFYLVRNEVERAKLPLPPEWVTFDHLAADLTAPQGAARAGHEAGAKSVPSLLIAIHLTPMTVPQDYSSKSEQAAAIDRNTRELHLPQTHWYNT
ncbi:UNVERIFIED_CONTAM: hypothetical protein K2H54_055449 [Gekko kuhli]